MADFSGFHVGTQNPLFGFRSGGNYNGFAATFSSAQVVIFVNRVWDSVASSLIRWNTNDSPDPTGASYPGPGTFGVHTSSYCVESIR